MTQPLCNYGFRCPYRADGEEEYICIYPHHPFDPNIEEMEFPSIHEKCVMDCPLMDPNDETMEHLLYAFEFDDVRQMVKDKWDMFSLGIKEITDRAKRKDVIE